MISDIVYYENSASEIAELRHILNNDKIGRLLLKGVGIKGNCLTSEQRNVAPTLNCVILKKALKLSKYDPEFELALDNLKMKLIKAGYE